MRSAVLGVAALALGLGAFRFAFPALVEHAIDEGGDSCDGSHLTSAELEGFVPGGSRDLKQVYRTVQHCTSGDIPTEATVSFAFASESDVQATAVETLAEAERNGWRRVSPPAGRAVTPVDGAVTLFLTRVEGGKTVHFDASVFAASSKPSPNPNANISKIHASGAATGVLLRIWVEGDSTIPTLDIGRFGIFATPDIGIGR